MPLFDDVNLSIEKGDIVSIVGNTGSGKSAFLKILAGLIKPDSGNVLFENQLIWELDDSKRNELRKNVAFYFSDSSLIMNMTIYDNLALRLRYHGLYPEKEIQKIVDSWLEKFGLMKYKQHFPAYLTLNLKQKVSLIRTIICPKPKIYFWDSVDSLEHELKAFVLKIIKSSSDKGIPSVFTNSKTVNVDVTKSFKINDCKLVEL